MTSHIREQAKLITAQLLSGAGIASGYAVGGLLAEEITGQTSMAGFAQMSASSVPDSSPIPSPSSPVAPAVARP